MKPAKKMANQKRKNSLSGKAHEMQPPSKKRAVDDTPVTTYNMTTTIAADSPSQAVPKTATGKVVEIVELVEAILLRTDIGTLWKADYIAQLHKIIQGSTKLRPRFDNLRGALAITAYEHMHFNSSHFVYAAEPDTPGFFVADMAAEATIPAPTLIIKDGVLEIQLQNRLDAYAAFNETLNRMDVFQARNTSFSGYHISGTNHSWRLRSVRHLKVSYRVDVDHFGTVSSNCKMSSKAKVQEGLDFVQLCQVAKGLALAHPIMEPLNCDEVEVPNTGRNVMTWQLGDFGRVTGMSKFIDGEPTYEIEMLAVEDEDELEDDNQGQSEGDDSEGDDDEGDQDEADESEGGSDGEGEN